MAAYQANCLAQPDHQLQPPLLQDQDSNNVVMEAGFLYCLVVAVVLVAVLDIVSRWPPSENVFTAGLFLSSRVEAIPMVDAASGKAAAAAEYEDSSRR